MMARLATRCHTVCGLMAFCFSIPSLQRSAAARESICTHVRIKMLQELTLERIEDDLRGPAVFATMPCPLRHRWVAGIYSRKSARMAAARWPEARSSASTKASNSAWSAGESDWSESRAVRQRSINSLMKKQWGQICIVDN